MLKILFNKENSDINEAKDVIFRTENLLLFLSIYRSHRVSLLFMINYGSSVAIIKQCTLGCGFEQPNLKYQL